MDKVFFCIGVNGIFGITILYMYTGWYLTFSYKIERIYSGYEQTTAPVNNSDEFDLTQKIKDIPTIYAVTPTYHRRTQMPDMTRLHNTLSQVRNLHWIVVEDANQTRDDIHGLLKSNNMTFTYLATPTKKHSIHKATAQRNLGIDWIRKHHSESDDGVVYFADDDNSYSLKLFKEMRYIRKIGVWPVGLSGGRAVEYPIVKNHTVVGFDAWAGQSRTFATDMAGFALNVKVLFNYPDMLFRNKGSPGYIETIFLEQCCKVSECEPKASECTEILVWHTKTR